MIILYLFPFLLFPNKCEQIMCIAPVVEEAHTAENYLLKKSIHYVYWGNWPVNYDCGGVLTEAYRSVGYRGEKISSNIDYCFKNNRNAKPGDVLINKNIWERHVALITSHYKNWRVQILDYVEKNTIASYRMHSFYEWIMTVDRECLMRMKWK